MKEEIFTLLLDPEMGEVNTEEIATQIKQLMEDFDNPEMFDSDISLLKLK